MATKKTTGKKLADMMYGNPEGAAFGITPMIGKRREDRQDREAAKSFPVDLARGAVAGFVGMPADILNIPGAVYSAVTDKDLYKIPYGSEDILKNLPFGTETPAGQFASGLGILGGGSANIGPAIRGAKALPGALKTAARNLSTPNTLNPQAGVIKMKGGNWLGGSVESGLKPLRSQTAGRSDPAEMLSRMRERYTPEEIAKLQGASRTHVLESIADLEKEVALNNWVDRNLGNYVKKEMATPEDPVRRLAEEGIVHIPSEQVGVNRYRAPKHREAYGGEQLGKSEAARAWEDASDVAINAPTARTVRANESLYQANPWTEKLSPEERVYALNRPASTQHEISGLGFDHILDVLREDVATGRIRPEQLNKVSMEQAVRRTYEYDQEMAKKMRETALKQQEGFPTYKEYPEGYRWIELNLTPEQKAIAKDYQERFQTELGKRVAAHPGDKSGKIPTAEIKEQLQKEMGPNPMQGLEDALKYEGNTMGHCVGGYCPDVVEGRSRIYSLRDAKGEPHVTVEVAPRKASIHGGEDDAAYARIVDEADRMFGAEAEGTQEYMSFVNNKLDLLHQDQPPAIVQIKGKQNKAPKEDYLPYVQDFVGSGQWSDVGDLQNTGLKTLDQAFPDYEMVKYFNRANPDKRYVSQKEIDDFTKEWNSPEASPDGMARGGPVHFSDNPDVMQLELAGGGAVRMQAGGLAKAAKALKAAKTQVPIKFPVARGPSVDEIRAMAERMAPQVTGEFVRAAPTKSKPNPSENVVGKSRQQFDREKNLQIGYQNIKPPVTPSEFDYAKHKDELLIGASGDVTPGNRMLVSIDNQPLSEPVHLQAGPEWGLYNPSAWAATDEMAKTWMKRADMAADEYNAKPHLHYHKMTPDANWYAMHHLHSLLGHMRPEELMIKNPELYAKMVDEIRTKDVGFGKHPEFVGFEDPLILSIHTQVDPNLRRHLGKILGQPTFSERYGLRSGQDVMAATSLPELRDLEVGSSGYAVVPLDTKAPLQHFAADSQTYDTGFPMAGPVERSKYPIPYQLVYRDTLDWMEKNPSEGKSSEFGRMSMIVPKQQIDDELIDAIGEYQLRMKALTGKKAGGAVRKAAGGEITADDLILEERKL
jgi:hypothetical protein